ncbi:MAG: hypothetical protein GXP01_08635, partial [Alphaproteobacteria bacterium]|nr:hypothetical protein [Alphaproteobacteria bacterium]
ALAIVCNGTATLELAIAGVPMVVIYVADAIMGRRYVKAGRPATALPNILARRALVPELIGTSLEVETIVGAAVKLRDDPAARAAQRDGFAKLTTYLERGERGAPLISAAVRVLELARNYRKSQN